MLRLSCQNAALVADDKLFVLVCLARFHGSSCCSTSMRSDDNFDGTAIIADISL